MFVSILININTCTCVKPSWQQQEHVSKSLLPALTESAYQAAVVLTYSIELLRTTCGQPSDSVLCQETRVEAVLVQQV